MNTTSLIFIVILVAALAQVKCQLSRDQKDFVLKRHNRYRSDVSPPARNMLEMMWSDELAQVAQAYSEKCVFDHNPMRDSQSASYRNVGENIAFRSPFTVWGENEIGRLMDAWHDEKDDFQFSSNRCTRVCGHYTQLVWAESDNVGCGATLCPFLTIPGRSSSRNALNLVCNYGPAGNFNGEKPYEQGTSCSNCPSGYSSCKENLCSMTEPETTKPEPTEPETTEPELTEPEPTQPEPTEPETTEPEPTEPEPTQPEPTEPEPTEPEPTQPEPTEPEPTEPEPTEPEPTEPEPTEPEPTEPEPTEPETTEPEPTQPEPTEPETISPPTTRRPNPPTRPYAQCLARIRALYRRTLARFRGRVRVRIRLIYIMLRSCRARFIG